MGEEMKTTQQSKTPHIILLPSPGMGHLIPLTEFAKRLVSHHPNFTVTLTIPTDSPPSKAHESVLDSLPGSVDHVFLPPVNLDDLPTDVNALTRISLTMNRSLSSLHDSIKILKSTHRVVALVVDIFGTDAFDVANEFNISLYIFFTSNAMVLSLFLHLPKLDQMYTCDYKDIPDPIKLPGCVPIRGSDIEPTQDKKDDSYRWILHHSKRYRLAEGILLNTFIDLELGPIKALREIESGYPPVYPVGPLIRTGTGNGSDDKSGCIEWLDKEPDDSVMFVCFGSGGTLSHEQLIELAFGLEMSRKKFLWVVKSPSEKAPNAAFFNIQSAKDPFDFLPSGFLDRTKGSGLVVPLWAPQIQVLAHRSTGGFLTHCGWNSTLESIINGVPLILWPLYAEQRVNAVMLENLEVALRPKSNETGLIGREEIARIVNALMEGDVGKRVRNRMMELKDDAAKVLKKDGSSTMSLSDVAQMWHKCGKKTKHKIKSLDLMHFSHTSEQQSIKVMLKILENFKLQNKMISYLHLTHQLISDCFKPLVT